jgi:uncharacterized protein YhjY with autotransporter beta-barrel domain
MLLAATPALAVNKTVNGITVDVNLPQAQRGVPYSFQITPSAGPGGPYTYAVTAGALPVGLHVSSSGLVTGVNCVNANGTFPFDLRITSGATVANFTGTSAFSINMTAGPSGACAVTIGVGTVPATGTTGTSYTGTYTSTGGAAPYTYTVLDGTLPPGLTLSSAGTISGTPTTAGTYTFNVRAADSGSNTGYTSSTITVSAGVPTITVSPTTLPGGTYGTAYSQSVTASGGTGSYTYSISAGALPAGLALDPSTGAIAGTPTHVGTASFTVSATDGSLTGTRSYSVAIAGVSLTVSPATLAAGTAGVAYSDTVTATGGSGTYTYAVTAGSLPTGLTLDGTTGAISGTPTAGGTFACTIRATDSAGNVGTRAYSTSIASPMSVTPNTLPGGTYGTAYSQTVTAVGGAGSYTYVVSAGTLPQGLALNGATGAITGTPTHVGASTFTIEATDGALTAVQSYTVSIAGVTLAVGPATLPAGTSGTAYAQTIAATGGNGTYTYSLVSGALPTGLALNTNTGALSGTPTVTGSYSFDVSAQDTAGNTGARSYTLALAAPPVPLTLGPATLPAPTYGQAYAQSLAGNGGSGTYTYAISAGALPDGLALDGTTGAITGTPTRVATFTFTGRVDDGAQTATRAYTLAVAPIGLAVMPATLPAGTAGAPYAATVSASSGTGSYTYAVTAGTLPAGLSLNPATGAITGTPNSTAAASFTITATDSAGNVGHRPYTFASAATLTLAPGSLPSGTYGTAYAQSLTAAGGSGHYAYSITGGALPSGLTLDATTGAIGGTPDRVGTYAFTGTVSDGAQTVSTAYSVAIAGIALSIAPASLPDAIAGTPYSQALSVTPASQPLTYAISGGALPAGLALDPATGRITGTPTGTGTATFTVQVTDAAGNVGTRTYTFALGAPLALGPTSLPNATYGVAYAAAVAGSGGSGRYEYALVAGALPAGLTLNGASGAIAGTPTRVASATFTLSVSDGAQTAQRAYSVTVAGVALTLNPATLPAATANAEYSQALTPAGGSGGYTCAVTAGTLPTGLTLDPATCVLSGRAGSGSYDFTITLTDSAGNSGSRRFAFVVEAVALQIGPAALPAARHGIAYSQALTASGGTAPYTFAIASGALPTGLALDATGRLTGKASAVGQYSVVVRVRDANGNVGTRAYAFGVDARPDPTRQADVAGTIAGQFASARRFGEGQLENVMRHLEGSRGAFKCGASGGITLSQDGTDPSRARRLEATDATSRSAPLQVQGKSCDGDQPQVGYWLAGSVGESGARDGHFSTDALTTGIDVRLGERVVIGGAIGFGLGTTRTGTAGSRSHDDARSAVAFLSATAARGWYVDAAIGYGKLGFESTRRIDTDLALVDGDRDGRMAFGSLSVGAEHESGPLTLGGYLRYDAVRSSLNAYAERGTSPYALAYDDSRQNVGSAILGGRAAYALWQPWGTVTPTVRAEYRRRVVGSYDQALGYADLANSGRYSLGARSADEDVLSIGAGLEARIGVVTFGLEYGTSALVEKSLEGSSLRATVRAGF